LAGAGRLEVSARKEKNCDEFCGVMKESLGLVIVVTSLLAKVIENRRNKVK
jgi:hypothetical protein